MKIRRINSRKDLANGSFSIGGRTSPNEDAGVTLQIQSLNVGEKDIEIILTPSDVERINDGLEFYLGLSA